MKTITLKHVILFGMIILSFTLNSATITSVQSGTWASTTTWDSGTIPTLNDDVIITTGHTVSSMISSTTAVSTDLCKNLTVNGIYQISNAKNANYTTNIYGSVNCNGTIELGQTPGYGAIFSYVGKVEAGTGLTGTGSAIFKTLTIKTSKPSDFLINLPVLTCTYGFAISKDSTKVTIAAGSTVAGSTANGITFVAVASTLGQGALASSLDIYGSLTCGTLYLCNNDSTTRKSQINVKNNGTLSVITNLTPLRGAVTGIIGTVGGSGVKLSVESGGNFNFPTLLNPMQFTEAAAGPSYDPKLLVAYYTGSIINGSTTATDLIKGDISSAVHNPSYSLKDAFYSFNQRRINLLKEFSSFKMYNSAGQMIMSLKKPESFVDFPASYKGNYIVVLTDNTGANYSGKIVVR
ncbi:MAG: hypothetical protein GZ091_15630 [Paludibacter sp.]|nr:hypothetical protein [Paludibacter sp.]